MNADTKFDAALGRQASIALDHAVLSLDRTSNSVHNTAKLDERAVTSALDHAPIVDRDNGIDMIAAQSPQPRQNAILVRAGEPAVADYIRRQDRYKFPCLGHACPACSSEYHKAVTPPSVKLSRPSRAERPRE